MHSPRASRRSILLALAAAILPAASARAGGPALYRPDTDTWAMPRLVAPVVDTPAPSPAGTLRGGDPWAFDPSVPTHPAEGGQHLWPDIAVAPDGTLGAAWMDDHAAGGYHIFYSASTDEGATWSLPEKVDDRAGGAYSKFVDLDFTPSGIPVLVWEDDRLGETRISVYLSKRDPSHGGTPWTPNVRVNTTGSPPGNSYYMNASLAVLDETRWWVAWTDWREGVFYQVYCRGTTDGGASWGIETRVSDGLGYQPVAGDPCLIADPTSPPGAERLYAVTNDWRGDVPGGRYPNVYAYSSTNGGASWSVGVRANDIEPYYQQTSSHALVRLEDGTLAAGWLNNSNLTIAHLRVCVSTDGGASWQASTQVDEPGTGGTGTYSSIAGAGGWLFAAFDIYVTDWDAYFRSSSDGGRTWIEPMVRMDDDATGAAAGNSVIAVSSVVRVHGIWMDTRPGAGSWKIYTAAGTHVAAGVEEPLVSRPGGLRCAPNPSRGGEAVRILGPSPSMSLVEIFDPRGRRVATIAGAGSLLWDGRDASGRAAHPGVYFVRLRGTDDPPPARIIRLP